MPQTTHQNNESYYPAQSDNPSTVRCKLFSDIVSENLCLLRKKELNAKGAFSCDGCPMDAVMEQQLRLMKDVLGIRGRENT